MFFQPDAFPDVAAARMKWSEVEKEQTQFVDSVTEKALAKMLPFRSTEQLSLAHLMEHLANHSTYHRGQVALMMRQLGAEPSATDFHVLLVEDHVHQRLHVRNIGERVLIAPSGP
jgi:uncharacterized damage-inducible protein DinB